MPENRNGCGGMQSVLNRNETVCIDTERVLDSCRDRDCFENVRVYLTDCGYDILDRTSSVRVKNAEIAWTYIGIDPVQFNRGFYSVTIRFYFKICFEACIGNGRSQEFEGICAVEKHVVLFGGESSVNVFRSNPNSNDFCGMPQPCKQCSNVPTAVVEVVDPIVLGTKIVESPQECNCSCCCCANEVPESVAARFNGALDFDDDRHHRYLTISLGLFSVVRIVRPAQYLVHATEYNVPDKQCVESDCGDPCGVFRAMPFPVNAFNPANIGGVGNGERDRCDRMDRCDRNDRTERGDRGERGERGGNSRCGC